jgi:hypothetical protein
MSKTSVINTMPQQDKDYEVAVDRYLIEIEHSRSDMSESQKRIERLRIETSDILAETRQVLSKLTS